MKTTENKNAVLMRRLVRKVCDYFVGGYENQMMDFPEDAPEYQEAYDILYNTPCKELLDKFYWMVMDACKKEYENARFAGREFTVATIGAYIIKEKLGKEMEPYRK